MASEKTTKLLDEIKELTILELNDLVKALEEEFGVSAVVAAAPGAAAGAPAAVSNTAGTFVCNSLMYAMLHHTACADRNIPCGFIHIPCLDCQEGLAPEVPTVKKEITVRAVTAAAEVLIRQLQEAAGDNERGGQDG